MTTCCCVPKSGALLGAMFFLATGTAAAQPGGKESPTPPNTLSAAERKAGWRLLFDGHSTRGWRAYNQDSMPSGWQATEGALTRVDRARDIIYNEKFKDFELSLEWKISAKGNSGIFYRGIEGPEALYYSAPEMQVLDDSGHADGRTPLTSAGSVYGLYPALPGVVKPVGEWNSVRIVVKGNHVEHWLNGQRIAEYEFWSADWTKRVADSKFRQWPEYGKAAEGYIGVQDHGDWVAYRNIKIRTLK